MSQFCVVLVRPRDPNNIGACARAMANFGLWDLRVVEPFAPVWREATSAVGAGDIMQQARQLGTLDEALTDCTFSLAATALRNRGVVQEVITLPHLNKRLETLPNHKVALVFGNEKTGLSNQDIERCDAILNIPTVAKQPSINLAQAVILTCYELSRRSGFTPLRSVAAPDDQPTDQQRELFLSAVEQLCEKTDLRNDLSLTQRQAFLRHALARHPLSTVQLFFLKTLVDR
ncbi:MAG: RNA methyltransferase, partial [Elusimicrobiaceae bacterium]|nr:RNA methyltransferase [Elusimicrobiaceae bacterium]